MGVKDLPAVLSYIGSTTGNDEEIVYIGHSMGTTMFFIMASELPDVAKRVKLMVGLAPVAYMTHIRSPIRYLAPWVNDFQVQNLKRKVARARNPKLSVLNRLH